MRPARLAGILGRSIYPLDSAVVQPMAAYAVRRLRSAYSGPALRLVRSSDSATMDVGWAGDVIDTDGALAWLGAATGRVSVWYDQSGNGNDAFNSTSATQPVFDGLRTVGGAPPVWFTKSTLQMPAGVVTQRNSFDVLAVAEFTSGHVDALYQTGASGTVATLFALNQIFQDNGAGLSVTPYRVMRRPALYRRKSAASPQANYFDQMGERHSVASTSSAASMTGGFLGNTSLAGGFEGEFRAWAFLFYGQALGAADDAAVAAALPQSLNVPTAPDSTVVYAGDSITAASISYAKGIGWTTLALDLLSPSRAPRVFNFASGGAQLQTLLTDVNTHVVPVCNRYSGTRIVQIAAGTNDLTIGGRTAAQIYADTQSYAAAVRATGAKCIVTTLLPNIAWNSTQQTTRNDFNAALRGGWASFADRLCDFAADATMGSQSAASNTALYPDGLHPSILGNGYLAPIAAAAANALL